MTKVDAYDPRLDGHDRGFPPQSAGMRASEIGRQGWRLHEHLETPIATLRHDHLLHNAAVMQTWCRAHEAELWPHAKTVMSPQLVALQLQSGAAGLTAATGAQAEQLLDWGAPGVFVANQLVQPRVVDRLVRRTADGGQELISYIDSVAGIEVLERSAGAAGVRLDVVLELGATGARTGVRDESAVVALSRALERSPHLRLVGAAGYEGSFGADRSPQSLARVDTFLERQAALLQRLVDAGTVNVERPIFSAGGSMFFDRVTRAASALTFPHRVLLRSGCYLLHDVGLFSQATPLPDDGEPAGLRAALTVWGTVHSRPEPTRAYLDVGRRDAGFDQGLPQPLWRVPQGQHVREPLEEARTIQLNDQHLHLEVSVRTRLAVGDRVELGISHPCTTMDKWRTIAVVTEGGTVVDAVTTRF